LPLQPTVLVGRGLAQLGGERSFAVTRRGRRAAPIGAAGSGAGELAPLGRRRPISLS
jgi:hypothetical protein